MKNSMVNNASSIPQYKPYRMTMDGPIRQDVLQKEDEEIGGPYQQEIIPVSLPEAMDVLRQKLLSSLEYKELWQFKIATAIHAAIRTEIDEGYIPEETLSRLVNKGVKSFINELSKNE